jgi:NAD dependent epimerase/dehydratase family enzyme
MAEQLLLSSQRVLPKRLKEAGFAFRFPHLEEALQDLIE